MLSIKLAYRNLMGAGLKAWLNIVVLSMAYVVIIWHQGIYTGMLKQGTVEMVKDEIGGGQFWYRNYDPYDPLSLDDSHGLIPEPLSGLIAQNKALAILVRSAAIYPKGRVQSILLKGIDPGQKVLGIPSAALVTGNSILPVLIGPMMAQNNEFKKGDYITIRLRNVYGTFDAVDGKIVEIMNTKVSTIDNGQFWVPLEHLQKLTKLEKQATMVVLAQGSKIPRGLADWIFRDQGYLLSDLNAVVRSKRAGSAVMYLILLFLAMLAIFDTQVLSIFRRRKEIGTLMALGLTRLKVIFIFTLEGMMNGILAVALGAIYGIPLLAYTARQGIAMPGVTGSFGLAIAEKLFPFYSARLVLGTIIIIMITVTIVSFLPTRKISKLKPTEALKGKLS